MLQEELSQIIVEQKAVASKFLKRYVLVDFYLPKNIPNPSNLSLLLINDGQNLDEMPFSNLYNSLLESNQLEPLFCVGIHAGKDRRNEYGVAKTLDFAGRGAKAQLYHQFILEELMPFIHTEYGVENFKQKAFAGFSMGGLTAIDMVWNYPEVFSTAGIFSGSLWWRSKSDEDITYNDDIDRIIHQQIKNSEYKPGLQFFFATGSLDETADRNGNGIIDSIDDTLALIADLKEKGYKDANIKYINYEDGRHDVATWGKAMPVFMLWGWGRKSELVTGNQKVHNGAV